MSERLARSVLTGLAALVVAFTVASIVSPPDPYSQLVVVGVLMLIALPVIYYRSYWGGDDLLHRH